MKTDDPNREAMQKRTWVFLSGFSTLIIKNGNIFIFLHGLPDGSKTARVFFNLCICFSEALSETFSSPSAILTGSSYLTRDQLCEFGEREIRELCFLPFEAIWTSTLCR